MIDYSGKVHLQSNILKYSNSYLKPLFKKEIGFFEWLTKQNKKLTYSEFPGDCIKPHMNRVFKV